MNDKTIINKLWWLKRLLNEQWGDREYKEIYNEELNTDICKEVDEIVAHIKLNY